MTIKFISTILAKLGFKSDNQTGKIKTPKAEKALSLREFESQTYLTRTETAKLLRCSPPTLKKYTLEGYLKSYRLGNKVLYRVDELETSLEVFTKLKRQQILKKNYDREHKTGSCMY